MLLKSNKKFHLYSLNLKPKIFLQPPYYLTSTQQGQINPFYLNLMIRVDAFLFVSFLLFNPINAYGKGGKSIHYISFISFACLYFSSIYMEIVLFFLFLLLIFSSWQNYLLNSASYRRKLYQICALPNLYRNDMHDDDDGNIREKLWGGNPDERQI